uniref:Membrane protein of ER body-like protein n=1 Tax=Leersia perrieri TaxID=77586 RepID=A0A0D9WKT5_9ORYZ
MMEVEKPWEFKEDVEIMEEEEEEDGSSSLQTRARNKNHALINGGEDEQEQEVVEEHKSVFFDPSQDSEHVTEVSGKNEATKVEQFVAKKEKAHEILSPKGKKIDTQENIYSQETNGDSNGSRLENGSHSNGSYEVCNSGETVTVAKGEVGLKMITIIDKNQNIMANSNGAANGSMNKTNIHEIEAEKDEDVIEGKVNIEEYDLEKILGEQETHDLFCPNCNSCITKRVILRKRKRTVRQTTRDEPPKKPQLEEPSAGTSNPPVPERQEPASPPIFRCLSCFAFFIPTGCGFNIFRIFGRTEVNQEAQVQEPSATRPMPGSDSCGSWLLSCFEPGDSPKKADAASSVEGSTTYIYSHGTSVKQEESKKPAESSPHLQPSNTKKENFATVSFGGSSSVEAHSSSSASIIKPGQSTTGFVQTGESHVVIGKQDAVWQQQITLPKPGEAAHLGTQKKGSQTFPTPEAKVPDANPAISIPELMSPLLDKPGQGIVIPPEAVGSQARPDDHVSLQVVPDSPVPPAPAPSEQRDDWDILKAIVYGGLVESITSLSVVSAAASSGAKTLDIFILGIANLIGGLPIIFHSIADLRSIGDVDENDEQVGHYWSQLGRRTRYQLHVFMAVLSYFLFGLLPPLIYAVSFRGGAGEADTNAREKKVAVVAAASLACIALLAIGKEHVKWPARSRSYVKTLLYYLTIGVSASGLSYVAGVLITKLLSHFGLIDDQSPPTSATLLFPDASAAATWASSY